MSCGFLLDGDRWRKTFDGIHVRLFHEAEELSGVGAEAFYVTALAFGVDGIEGEARLTGAAQAGNDRELIAGDGYINVSEVVFSGAPDDQRFFGHSLEGSLDDKVASRGRS